MQGQVITASISTAMKSGKRAIKRSVNVDVACNGSPSVD
jgi:hypothetical protein